VGFFVRDVRKSASPERELVQLDARIRNPCANIDLPMSRADQARTVPPADADIPEAEPKLNESGLLASCQFHRKLPMALLSGKRSIRAAGSSESSIDWQGGIPRSAQSVPGPSQLSS
jgi:hypothetical protein